MVWNTWPHHGWQDLMGSSLRPWAIRGYCERKTRSGGGVGMGQVRAEERSSFFKVKQKTLSLCWSPSPVLGKHMRSSIWGIHQECFLCQNYLVTLQGKFNQAPTAKTCWFPSLCQGGSKEMRWMPRSAPKRHQPSRERPNLWGWGGGSTVRLAAGAGNTTKGFMAPVLCEPPLFLNLGEKLPKEGSCKRHSSWLTMNRNATCPTQPPLPSATHPHLQQDSHPPTISPISRFVHPGTWYIRLHCSWREHLLYPLLCFTGDLLLHLN